MSSPAGMRMPIRAMLADIDEIELFGRHVAIDEPTRGAVRSLLTRLSDPDLRLPILPASAQKAMMLANDPGASLHEMHDVVESEPLIALRLMETANSALYSGYSDVSTLRAALARVGLETVRGVVMSALMEAHALGGASDKRLDILRRHSILVAHVARKLCADLDIDGEAAFACGLFHDVGQAVLLEIIRVHGPATQRADDLLDVLHGVAGELLLRSWGLPRVAAHVARRHHDYGHPSEPSRYHRMANVVALADAAVYCVGVGRWPLDNELSAQQAAEDLGLHADASATLVEWARERGEALGLI